MHTRRISQLSFDLMSLARTVVTYGPPSPQYAPIPFPLPSFDRRQSEGTHPLMVVGVIPVAGMFDLPLALFRP